MKIVLDTNVLVMALRSRRGASFHLLSELPAKDFEIVLTIPLYTEYQDVLSRPEILELGYTLNDIKELTRYLASISELLSILVFKRLNQAATWSADFTSIPSLNFTPLITFAR